MARIKIVEVSDKYINYMKNYFYETMMDNKTNYRKHSRKYIGVVLKINNYNYFAPLSSPKKSDYLNNGNIRKSSTIVLRMVENKLDGSNVLLGSIKLNNMLPVPDTEINVYDLDNEIDINYKNLVFNELLWIEKKY